MNKTMGEYATFWFYMCWCIAGLFFVYIFLPETKGKSLDEIERMFANKKKQQLWAANSGISAFELPKPNDGAVFTVEPIPRVPLPSELAKVETGGNFHINDAYAADSDDEDNDEVVVTPL